MVLTGREMDVMNVLWTLESATVSEVLENLPDDLAYTTVLTILRRLEKKGHVRHEEQGKAHRYFPRVRREEAQDSAIKRVTQKLFHDSPELLMTRLLRKGGVTEEQLRSLRALLDERLKEGEEE
ncbi:BlaI/MecI/CopY family transcriptional regulator [Gemmatimonadota bacterium]